MGWRTGRESQNKTSDKEKEKKFVMAKREGRRLSKTGSGNPRLLIAPSQLIALNGRQSTPLRLRLPVPHTQTADRLPVKRGNTNQANFTAREYKSIQFSPAPVDDDASAVSDDSSFASQSRIRLSSRNRSNLLIPGESPSHPLPARSRIINSLATWPNLKSRSWTKAQPTWR
jgi:hypothetical protein